MATNTPTTPPPEFVQGKEVVCIFPKSKYFGQKGSVYGHGLNEKDKKLRIYVQWPDGNRLQYRLDNLGPAPKPESEYLHKRSNNRHGTRTAIHIIPAESRVRPNIFTQLRRNKE